MMTREQIHEILDVVLDVNGLGERKREVTGAAPTAFFEFSGHIATIYAHIHPDGWVSYGDGKDFSFDVEKPLDLQSLEELKETARQAVQEDVDFKRIRKETEDMRLKVERMTKNIEINERIMAAAKMAEPEEVIA